MSLRFAGRMRGAHPWGSILLLVALAAACDTDEPGTTGSDIVPRDSVSAPVETTEAAPVLVDSSIPSGVAGEDGWGYVQSSEVDLDGDGDSERVVLAARVEMVRGRPAWDDGQPWQVYVQESSGERTDLYRRFVQLGTLTMRVTVPQADRAREVVLLEHLPDRLSVFEIAYEAPGRIRTRAALVRDVDPAGETASPQLP